MWWSATVLQVPLLSQAPASSYRKIQCCLSKIHFSNLFQLKSSTSLGFGHLLCQSCTLIDFFETILWIYELEIGPAEAGHTGIKHYCCIIMRCQLAQKEKWLGDIHSRPI